MRKALLWTLLLVAVAFYVIVVSGWWIEGNNRYEQQTREHCQQYRSIPEKHLDRVPDGCVPYYFEGR